MKPDNLNKSTFSLLLVSYMIAAPVRADRPFNVQVDVGRSNVSDSSVPLDEDATGFRLTAGYQIVPWLAVDLGYVDFGMFESNLIDPNGPPIPLEGSADGLELGLVGRVPLGDKFALTGRAGMLWWNSDVVVGGVPQSDSGNDFAYGLGVEMALNQRFVVTGAWQKFDIADTDVDLFSLGLRLRFGGSN